MGARRGGGKSRRSPLPGKSPKIFFTIWGGPLTTFFSLWGPCGGLFATFFSMGGGDFLGLPSPTKISAGAHDRHASIHELLRERGGGDDLLLILNIF